MNLILRSGGLLLISGYLLLAACTGSDGNLILGTAATPGLQNDEPAAAPMMFQDFAQPVYSVSGQWLCSVSGGFGGSDDQFVLSADGSGNFQRFGRVFWNRDLINSALTLHTVQDGTLAMHTLFAGNDTLQFNLDLTADQTLTSDEVYACVLSAAG